jgi:hypothetical protein
MVLNYYYPIVALVRVYTSEKISRVTAPLMSLQSHSPLLINFRSDLRISKLYISGARYWRSLHGNCSSSD